MAENGDLLIHVDQSANLRMADAEGLTYLKPLTRSVDFWMTASAPGHHSDWLINYYNGTYHIGAGDPEA